MSDEPIVKLQPGGQASIVNYNVPDRTAYPARGLVEIGVPVGRRKPFKAKYYAAAQSQIGGAQLNLAETTRLVDAALTKNYFPRSLFPHIQLSQSALVASRTTSILASQGDSPSIDVEMPLLSTLDAELIAKRKFDGQELVIYRNLYGAYRHKFIKAPTVARPRLYLVETYRLTSFLGDYGAGRTINTFSLLPGEKTTISLKTYKKSTAKQAQSSSILDSYSEESADSFEEQMGTESGDKESEDDSFSYYLDGEFEAGVDVGIASAGGELRSGFKGASNSARESFSNKTMSATEKHSAKASASRDIEISTSSESTSEVGQEKAVEREIENINVGRTLNFVFRQMNQEFISIFHLVDVRIGFTNGFRSSREEEPIHRLDDLLETVMIGDDTLIASTKEIILGELRNVFDHHGVSQSIIEERRLIGPNNEPSEEETYFRVKTDMNSEYQGKQVQGVILAAKKFTMRTDGVIVEALLGQAEALDTYSKHLQEEAIADKKLTNALVKAKVDREELAQKIVQEKNSEGAAIFAQVFPPPADCREEPEVILPSEDEA